MDFELEERTDEQRLSAQELAELNANRHLFLGGGNSELTRQVTQFLDADDLGFYAASKTSNAVMRNQAGPPKTKKLADALEDARLRLKHFELMNQPNATALADALTILNSGRPAFTPKDGTAKESYWTRWFTHPQPSQHPQMMRFMQENWPIAWRYVVSYQIAVFRSKIAKALGTEDMPRDQPVSAMLSNPREQNGLMLHRLFEVMKTHDSILDDLPRMPIVPSVQLVDRLLSEEHNVLRMVIPNSRPLPLEVQGWSAVLRERPPPPPNELHNQLPYRNTNPIVRSAMEIPVDIPVATPLGFGAPAGAAAFGFNTTATVNDQWM